MDALQTASDVVEGTPRLRSKLDLFDLSDGWSERERERIGQQYQARTQPEDVSKASLKVDLNAMRARVADYQTLLLAHIDRDYPTAKQTSADNGTAASTSPQNSSRTRKLWETWTEDVGSRDGSERKPVLRAG